MQGVFRCRYIGIYYINLHRWEKALLYKTCLGYLPNLRRFWFVGSVNFFIASPHKKYGWRIWRKISRVRWWNPGTAPHDLTEWLVGIASLFEVVTNPRVLFLVIWPVNRVCPKIYRVLRVKITTAAVKTARCDINDSLVVNVSTAFTSQIRDDAFKWLRWIVNKLSSHWCRFCQ